MTDILQQHQTKKPAAKPQTVVHGRKRESSADRAENIAYTINHALACTATDFIDPFIQNQTQKHFNKKIGIGCGHSHSQEGTPVWHNVVGELAGDFLAVPVTVAVQHFLPGVMDGIRWVAEPIMGDMFRHGAKTAAKDQMLKATYGGYPLSKEGYEQQVRNYYNYEVQHLPQGLLWTGLAALFNVEIMKGALKSPDSRQVLWEGKLKGAAISAGLLFGFRGLDTEQAHQWDQWSTRNVFLPTTKKIGNLFGVKEEDVQRLADKQAALEHPHHAGRVQPQAAAAGVSY